MKKVFIGLTLIVFVALVATACAETTIMNGYVYSWMNIETEFKTFNELEDGEEYVKDGRFYMWSTSASLIDDMKGLSHKDIEYKIEEMFSEHGANLVDAHVYSAGKDCIWVQVNTIHDLTKLGILNYDEPIYGLDVICWKDNEHMH